ncbi:hypothetical protein Q1695_007556 [Nippostrongylus brasiliensis]|nr:hypothetical protein Q1695_007556 [Nippostrongylus brasiliensis]
MFTVVYVLHVCAEDAAGSNFISPSRNAVLLTLVAPGDLLNIPVSISVCCRQRHGLSNSVSCRSKLFLLTDRMRVLFHKHCIPSSTTSKTSLRAVYLKEMLSPGGVTLLLISFFTVSTMSETSATVDVQRAVEQQQPTGKIPGKYHWYYGASDKRLRSIWKEAVERARIMERILEKKPRHRCMLSPNGCKLTSFAESTRIWRRR